MAWIESHQTLRDHPKTKRLCRLLGVRLPEAIGYLHLLWWWCLDYAQDGKLGRYDAQDIADGVGWEGDATQLVEALVRAGFLEREGDTLVVHDWWDYAAPAEEQRRRPLPDHRDAEA